MATELIVMKFGGVALATPKFIVYAAKRIRARIRSGAKVIAVVSAMGDETDRLLALTQHLVPAGPHQDETDIVLCAGEQVAAGMMALALRSLGVSSRSFLAHQLPIVTDGRSGDAQILGLDSRHLLESLKNGETAVVAGFQGINSEGKLVTLGRGGSDTTAVAIAASLDADSCEFFKDVDGVYSSNPAVNRTARRFNYLSYEEMENLTVAGAEVLHTRAVRMAARFGVPLHVRSAFHDSEGTRIGHDHEQQISIQEEVCV